MTRRILIADDDADVREMTTFLMERDGYEVVAVESGMALVAEAMSRSFDLLLVDIKMPNGSGDEAIRLLRAKDVMTPVIVLTGIPYVDRFPFEIEILRKPVDPEALRGMVRELFNP